MDEQEELFENEKSRSETTRMLWIIGGSLVVLLATILIGA